MEMKRVAAPAQLELTACCFGPEMGTTVPWMNLTAQVGPLLFRDCIALLETMQNLEAVCNS